MKTQTYIEVNGKRYDAKTGKLLSMASSVPQGTSLDGVRTNKSSIIKPTPAHKKKRQLQKSQTLMRHTVKKPTGTKKAPAAQSLLNNKSSLISKFGNQLQPLKPRMEPVMLAHSRDEIEKLHKQSKPAQSSLAPASKSDALVTQALASATSHNAPKHVVKKRHRVSEKLGISKRTARFGSALVAVLILGGFFAYQNIPNFAMRVAATRAGFAAKMPGYQPSGFGYNGPVKYRSGEVTVNFSSNTNDGRSFALTQRASSWNNDALLANFVLGTDSQYQTFQENNKTIYIYDGGNATWVQDGIWYQLEGDAQLTTDQISRLANSL